MSGVVLLLVSALMASGDSTGCGGGVRQTFARIEAEALIVSPDRWMLPGSAFAVIDGDSIPLTTVGAGRRLALPAGFSLSEGDTLLVCWKSLDPGIPTFFRRYEPYLPPGDTSTRVQNSQSSTQSPLREWGSLRRSGSITRGFRFGEAGGSSASGLHLELSGSPSPGVTLDAMIDDRSIPAAGGGGSASLRELDRMLIRVRTPRLTGTLGDWDLDWRSGEYGTIERRLKGGEAAVRSAVFSGAAAVAGGDGRFLTSQLTGRARDYGPYELTDRYGRPGVGVAQGSERVRLDGRLLKRGVHADYRFDYERGAVTFTPKVAIRDGSRIDVEYQAFDDAYASRLLGVRSAAQGGKLAIEASLIREGADEERPLAFDWTASSREAVERAGDDPAGAATSGIDSVGVGAGDYVFGASPAGEPILSFSPPDSLGKPTGYLRVAFTADPHGNYRRRFDPSLQTFIYEWIASGGAYSPVRRIALPDRTTLAQSRGVIRLGDVSGEIEAAVSDFDANTLSALQDDDNRGGALRASGGWSRADSSLEVKALFRRRDSRFKPLSRDREADFDYKWGVPLRTFFGGETSFEGSTFYRPFDEVGLTLEGGRLSLGSSLTSDRLKGGTSYQAEEYSLSGAAEALLASDDSTGIERRSLRLSGGADKRTGSVRPGFRWRRETLELDSPAVPLSGSLFHEYEPSLLLQPADWTDVAASLLYREDYRIEGAGRPVDSRSALVRLQWNGRRSAARWSGSGAHSIRRYYGMMGGEAASTQAVGSLEAGTRNSPVRFSGDYSLTTGSSRAEVWIATYVGEGRGTYRREGDRYVPDSDGDFILMSEATDTLRFETAVRFTGRLDLRFKRGRDDAYPLGVSGASTYFDADAVTLADAPIRAMLLDRGAFRSPDAVRMRWNWREEIRFLEGSPGGEGRLTLRRDEARDAGWGGGEETLGEALELQTTTRFNESTRLIVEPFLKRDRRWALNGRRLAASVRSSGFDLEGLFAASRWIAEYSVRPGYERRREAVTGKSVDEVRLLNRAGIPVGRGRIRCEGEWRRLSTASASPGYDLTRGWTRGDNWLASLYLDYSLGRNLTAGGFVRSRWRGGFAPLVSGGVEATATL